MSLALLIPVLTAASLLLSAAAVPLVRRLALRGGLVDDPGTGAYKTHTRPIPYGGGLAIWLGACLPAAGLALWLVRERPDAIHDGGRWLGPWLPLTLYPLEAWSPSALQVSQVLSALGAATAVLLLGLADDRRQVPAGLRLGVQVALAAGLVGFVPGFRLVWAGVGEPLAIAGAVVWIVALTNAFNFLDNMNGLAAGVAAIGLGACGALALASGHLPAALLCAVLVGAAAGFLVHNFPTASIFMGDAGGLFLGFLAGSLSVMLWQHLAQVVPDPDAAAYRLLPMVAFGVPVYDLVTVVALRLRRGVAPWVGDTGHVSHRLVAAGLDRTRAVLVLYAVAAATALPCLAAARGDLGAGRAVAAAGAGLGLFAVLDLGRGMARRRTG